MFCSISSIICILVILKLLYTKFMYISIFNFIKLKGKGILLLQLHKFQNSLVEKMQLFLKIVSNLQIFGFLLNELLPSKIWSQKICIFYNILQKSIKKSWRIVSCEKCGSYFAQMLQSQGILTLELELGCPCLLLWWLETHPIFKLSLSRDGVRGVCLRVLSKYMYNVVNDHFQHCQQYNQIECMLE